MKSLMILAAFATTAYVGYSYNATDGESCLVCPMTGEPVFTSADSEAAPGSCCAGNADAMLTSMDSEGSSCCSQAKPSCCAENGAEAMLTSIEGETAACCSKAKAACCSEGGSDAMLTSTDAAECHGDCEKGCCKDKTDAVDVAASQDETAVDVVAEVTETE